MGNCEDPLEELIESLCDCESYRVCEWHQRLRRGECRATLIEDLEAELNESHYRYGVENGDIDAAPGDA